MKALMSMVKLVGWVWLSQMVEGVCGAGPVEIRIPKTLYRPGEHVVALIKAPGQVGIENDIGQQSFTAQIGGTREVDLGPINKPGLYTVRVVSGTEATAAVLFAYPDGAQMRLEISTWSTDRPVPAPQELMERFVRAMSRERVKACAQRALKRWLPANVASVGGTSLYCMVCVVPGGQFACSACVSSAGANMVDLSLEILTELVNNMEQDRLFSPQEAKAIRAVVHSGRGAFAILSAGGKLERFVEGANFAVQTVVEEEAATLVVGNLAGQVNKATMLIKITKK
ncbi:MAG: hypothetical protein NZ602_03505 [Thermoguttaceae bacterium]|nr:hypothetical protein [Thermoguttaceae bacterium]MDW8037380.1 hypothetical protein [Thermoguttaceae bacterium]